MIRVLISRQHERGVGLKGVGPNLEGVVLVPNQDCGSAGSVTCKAAACAARARFSSAADLAAADRAASASACTMRNRLSMVCRPCTVAEATARHYTSGNGRLDQHSASTRLTRLLEI